MNTFNFDDIMAEADKVTASDIQVKTGKPVTQGVPGMSIVNNRNGVRISFNAALLEKLGVTEKDDTLDVLGIESLRVVLVERRSAARSIR